MVYVGVWVLWCVMCVVEPQAQPTQLIQEKAQGFALPQYVLRDRLLIWGGGGGVNNAKHNTLHDMTQ